MDINEQLQPIVAGLIGNLKTTIESELRDQISAEVINKLASTELDSVVNKFVEQYVQSRINNFNFVNLSDEILQTNVNLITEQITRTLAASANTQISTFVNQQLAAINITEVIGSLVQNKVGSMLQTQSFPPNSISHASINFNGVKLTGDSIRGGIIEQFGSTGIEDRASFVQLTLMDHASAFEGPVFAPTLKVTGDVQVNGQLILNGSIDTTTPVFKTIVDSTTAAVRLELNNDLFNGFTATIFDRIQQEGLDLSKITQDGKEIIKGNQLGYHIVDTNIKRLGLVVDLQTDGENLLSDTLYVTKGRVGINSMDPSAVLSVWDQEVEITVSKHAQDTGYVGTPRRQKLVLGANSRENITLDVDGSVQVDSITIGGISMSSSDKIPNYPGKLGQMVWNSNPGSGGAIGWVCLGATRWAKFGTIE